MIDSHKHNSTMVSDASPMPTDPNIKNGSFIQQRRLPTMNTHRIGI